MRCFLVLAVVLGVVFGAAGGPAAAGPDHYPNNVVLRVAGAGPDVRKTVLTVLRSRLDRFGVAARVEAGDDELIRVALPALGRGQPRRILVLLTSPGDLDVVPASGGDPVVPASAVRGIVSSLEGNRIRFRLRLTPAGGAGWKGAPSDLALRWDGQEILYFRKPADGAPTMLFPEAYPRDELRVLFCTVLFRPLPPGVEIVSRDLGAVTDPDLAWARLAAKWSTSPPVFDEAVTFRREDPVAVYSARTRLIDRDGTPHLLMEDHLLVPGHPEEELRTEMVTTLDFRLVEGRVRTGGNEFVVEPDEVFLAPGVILRVAPLLPARPGGLFGPGGRIRVREGPDAGAVEIVAPGRPAFVVVRRKRVRSFVLVTGGEPFVRTR